MGFFCTGVPTCTRCGLPNEPGWRQKCRAPDATPDVLPAAATNTQVQLSRFGEPCCGGAAVSIEEPGLLDKWKEYRAAHRKWRRAKRPVRSAERIAELLQICEACPCLLDHKTARQRCGVCGCPVNDLPEPEQNKLAMATEACPGCPGTADPSPRWTADQ